MTLAVLRGKPAEVILQHAASAAESTGLIVIGAPSRAGFARLRLPSVAQAVVHQTDRPTLIVAGSDSVASANVPFRRVLVAIDFSPASSRRWTRRIESFGRTARRCGCCM